MAEDLEAYVQVVLPAYAGMIPISNTATNRSPCAPRVCGDDPIPSLKPGVSSGCSPRMRG